MQKAEYFQAGFKISQAGRVGFCRWHANLDNIRLKTDCSSCTGSQNDLDRVLKTDSAISLTSMPKLGHLLHCSYVLRGARRLKFV